MTADFESLPASLRDEHAAFLRERRDVLVTFGPIRHAGGTPAGYAYQCDYPGTSVEPMLAFLRDDPLTKAGGVHGSIARGWRCALKHRQPAMPERRACAASSSSASASRTSPPSATVSSRRIVRT